MKFKAFNDRVAIKQDDAMQVSEGGLFIPATAQQKEYWGTVISMGSEVDIEDIKIGSHVFFDKHGASYVQVSRDEQLIVLRQTDILGGEVIE
jgi:chaperonin GroES